MIIQDLRREFIVGSFGSLVKTSSYAITGAIVLPCGTMQRYLRGAIVSDRVFDPPSVQF